MIFQDKIKTLEIELDEERSGVELLNDRITRSRDQVPHFACGLANQQRAFFLFFSEFFSCGLVVHSCLLSGPSQVDQLRSELMQERSARHDLEMDKSALERQVTKPLVEVRSFEALHLHFPTSVSDEGAQVSHSRHGESDTPHRWNHTAGKQNSGAGGETSQRGEVRLTKKSKTSFNGLACFEMFQIQK